MADLINGVNNVQGSENVKPQVDVDEKKVEETEKVSKVNIPEKKEKRIVGKSDEGDTLSISETGENYYKLKESMKEAKPILPEVEVKPVQVKTEKEITDTTNTTDNNEESILNTDSSSDNLSRYSQDQLKRMLDRGEITTSEYNLELALRKAEGTLDDAEEKILDTEEKLDEIEQTNGQGIENLINGKYGAQK